jgi:drug/metabolite transporter (DMT)-like permease
MYTLLALLFSTLWASAFMVVKLGLKSSPPLFLMGCRFLFAGSILLGFAKFRGYRFPDSLKDWTRLGLLGLLNNAAYLGLSAIALRHLSGGMGAVLASTNPLMLALVSPLFLRERLRPLQVLGFLVAFISVVGVMYGRIGADDRLSSMLLALLANGLMVVGTVLFKRWEPKQPLVVITGVQLLVASIVLLVPSLIIEPVGAVKWDTNFLIAISYLAIGVSCGAMLIWFYLLRAGGASRASTFLFLNPVLGIFLAALLLGEPLRGKDFVGGFGVALGIYLAQKSL